MPFLMFAIVLGALRIGIIGLFCWLQCSKITSLEQRNDTIAYLYLDL